MRMTALLLACVLGSCTNDPYRARFFGPGGEVPAPRPDTLDPLFGTLGAVLEGSVQVIARNERDEGVSRGSGVVVGVGRYLTARHMTEDGVASWVVKLGGQYVIARCIARGAGPLDDWALLESERGLGKAVPVLDARTKLAPFAQAVAVGYGLGYPDPTVTIGHIQTAGDQFVRFSAPITYGNSGGGLYAVVDGELRLVAITVSVGVGGGTAVEHMGFGIATGFIRKQGGIR